MLDAGIAIRTQRRLWFSGFGIKLEPGVTIVRRAIPTWFLKMLRRHERVNHLELDESGTKLDAWRKGGEPVREILAQATPQPQPVAPVRSPVPPAPEVDDETQADDPDDDADGLSVWDDAADDEPEPVAQTAAPAAPSAPKKHKHRRR